MHTLLFAQGNWIFDADSLLITLFPEAFWAAMAGLWILSSIVLALITGIVGKYLPVNQYGEPPLERCLRRSDGSTGAVSPLEPLSRRLQWK